MHSEDILQRCLEELATGRQTPQECAAQFAHVPGLASELAAAQALMSWPPPTIDTAAVRRHQARLRAVVAAQARPRRPGFFALPRWAEPESERL